MADERPVNRGGRPLGSVSARNAALDGALVSLFQTGRPMSVRHAFYRMTDPTLEEVAVPKTEAGYRLVQRRCTSLRRRGLLPYGWVSDSTRRGFHVRTYTGAGNMLEQTARLYREDAWKDAEALVEVWCESRSVAGVIQADCAALGVSLYPCGGFASLTLAYEAAEGIREEARGRPVRIVYVGDYDPAGVLIDRSVIGELRRHLPGMDVEEVRVAITAEQAERLPSKPRKAADKRRPEIRRTVEAEAMPAAELRALLRIEVESFLPAGALAACRVAEESEREAMRWIAAVMDSGGVGEVVSALQDRGWSVK